MKDSAILLYRVGMETYIMQIASGTPASYDLFILKRSGKNLSIYDCASYKDETLSQLQIKKAAAVISLCDISELGQLVRLAQRPPDVPRKQIIGEVLLME